MNDRQTASSLASSRDTVIKHKVRNIPLPACLSASKYKDVPFRVKKKTDRLFLVVAHKVNSQQKRKEKHRC